MTRVLSQEEIDSLLSNVSEEHREDDPGKIDKKVALYDFKHPNLISKEQMRLLETIHEGLCRNFGVYLSAQLRMFVEMTMLAIDQIQYSEFVMSIAPPSCVYTCEIDKPHSKMVVEFNPEFAIFVVERLFGGKGSFISELRPISVIEQKIMRRVVNRFVDELCKNWNPVVDFDCYIQGFENNPEFVQVVPSNEPVVVISMEIRIYGHSSLVNICYPYMWISSIVSLPTVQEKILFGSRDITIEETNIITQNLHQTPITLKAILGQNHLTVREFLGLRENDVLKLNSMVESPVSVYANRHKILTAAIGTKKRKYAIRVNSVEFEKIKAEE